MKRYFWVFAAFVFVVSFARPVFAANGCGGNPGRYTNTQTTPATNTTPRAPAAGSAQSAGTANALGR